MEAGEGAAEERGRVGAGEGQAKVRQLEGAVVSLRADQATTPRRNCHDHRPEPRSTSVVRGTTPGARASGVGRPRRGGWRVWCSARPHRFAWRLRRVRCVGGGDGADPGRCLHVPPVRPGPGRRCDERPVRGTACGRGRRQCPGSRRSGGRGASCRGGRGGLRGRDRCGRRLHPHAAARDRVRVVRPPSHARSRTAAHGERRRGVVPAVSADRPARRSRSGRHLASRRHLWGRADAVRHDGGRAAPDGSIGGDL